MQKIALGHEHQRILPCELWQALGNAGQQVNGMVQHIASHGQYIMDHIGRDLALGDVNCCFDHGQHEPFYPIAITTQVAPLSGQQLCVQGVRGHVSAEHIRKAVLGEAKEFFILPQRVIGIEAQNFDTAWQAGPFH